MRKIQLFQKGLSTLISLALILSSTELTQAASFASVRSPLPRLADLSLPANLGFVTDAYGAGTSVSQSVVIIQDLHVHPPVQKKIRDILDFLLKQSPLKNTRLIGIEGAEGNIPTMAEASRPNPALKRKVADYLIEQGELTGAEAFAIENGQGDLLWGVENDKYYQADRKLYVMTLQARKALRKRLEFLDARLADVTKRIKQSSDVEEVSRTEKALETGTLPPSAVLRAWLKQGADLPLQMRPYPRLRALAQVIQVEQEITNSQVVDEAASFLSILNPYLAISERNELKRLGKTDPSLFYLRLAWFARERHIENRLPPRLQSYLKGLVGIRRFSDFDLLEELLTFAPEFKAFLSKDRRLQNAFLAQKSIRFLIQYLSQQASDDEVMAWSRHMQEMIARVKALGLLSEEEVRELSHRISNQVDFYSLALVRNEPMAQNLLSEMKRRASSDMAILVAGGFHARGLTDSLRKAGVSYVVVSPAIDEELKPAYTALYEERLADNHLGADQIEKGVSKNLGIELPSLIAVYVGMKAQVRAARVKLGFDTAEQLSAVQATPNQGSKIQPVMARSEGFSRTPKRTRMTRDRSGALIGGFGLLGIGTYGLIAGTIPPVALAVMFIGGGWLVGIEAFHYLSSNSTRQSQDFNNSHSTRPRDERFVQISRDAQRLLERRAREKFPADNDPNAGVPYIEDTSRSPRPEWLLGGNPRAIERQEKEGQKQLSRSQMLPVEGTKGHEAEWAAIGVELGEPAIGDELFRFAKFPEGWKIVPTDHDMWSNLVDASGQIRAKIFYKAAFYDRRADVRIEKPTSEPPKMARSEGHQPLAMMKLRNGQSEPRATVLATMMSLRGLLETNDPMKAVRNAIAFYELVQKARNPDHNIDASALPLLEQLALVRSDGTIHSSIRNIVVSAAVGEALELGLQSPLENEPPTMARSEGRHDDLYANLTPKERAEVERVMGRPLHFMRAPFDSKTAKKLKDEISRLSRSAKKDSDGGAGSETRTDTPKEFLHAVTGLYSPSNNTFKDEAEFYSQEGINIDDVHEASLSNDEQAIWAQVVGIFDKVFERSNMRNTGTTFRSSFRLFDAPENSTVSIVRFGNRTVFYINRKFLRNLARLKHEGRAIILPEELQNLGSIDLVDSIIHAVAFHEMGHHWGVTARGSKGAGFEMRFVSSDDERKLQGLRGGETYNAVNTAAYKFYLQQAQIPTENLDEGLKTLPQKVRDLIQKVLEGVGAAQPVTSQAQLLSMVNAEKPKTHGFIKDAPIIGYRITSDEFDDLPEPIQKQLGLVDKTAYAADYLKDKVGSIIVLQMNGDKPDFYPIGHEAFQKYRVVSMADVQAKNSKLMKGLGNVEGMKAVLASEDPNLIAVLKTVPVQMVRMSEAGFPLGQEVTIQAPWGPQTKPAGKDAYLVWNTDHFYIVNTDDGGLPISYVAVQKPVQSQAELKPRIESEKRKYGFVKDAPILGYRISSDKFEDLPQPIQKQLGLVDKTAYSPDYLKDKVGSIIVLQMNGATPDFYPIGHDSLAKYRVVSASDVQAKNAKLVKGLNSVEGMDALLQSNDPNLIGALKTVPVEMTRMSDIGYSVDEEVTIESPWGVQTKPAGKDAYLVLDTSKLYYMVNTDDAGLPISYVPAPLPVQTQANLKGKIDSQSPKTHPFVKDAPILGYRITSDKFEDLPGPIQKQLGLVDQTAYQPDYLKDKVGSIVVLQMNGAKPDFYPIGPDSFQKYRVVSVSDVDSKNPKLMKSIKGVEGIDALINSNDPNLIGALKTVPVQMVRMSEIGYPVAQDVTIQAPWGEQTKPAGKDAYLVWDAGQNQYYMVNTDDNGLPISYVSTLASPIMARSEGNLRRSNQGPSRLQLLQTRLMNALRAFLAFLAIPYHTWQARRLLVKSVRAARLTVRTHLSDAPDVTHPSIPMAASAELGQVSDPETARAAAQEREGLLEMARSA